MVAASGSKYAALVSQFGRGNISLEEQNRIKPMIDALLHRGIDDETFRGDITADELGFLFGSLLEAGARMAAEHQACRRESRGPGHFGVPARHSAPQGGRASLTFGLWRPALSHRTPTIEGEGAVHLRYEVP